MRLSSPPAAPSRCSRRTLSRRAHGCRRRASPRPGSVGLRRRAAESARVRRRRYHASRRRGCPPRRLRRQGPLVRRGTRVPASPEAPSDARVESSSSRSSPAPPRAKDDLSGASFEPREAARKGDRGIRRWDGADDPAYRTVHRGTGPAFSSVVSSMSRAGKLSAVPPGTRDATRALPAPFGCHPCEETSAAGQRSPPPPPAGRGSCRARLRPAVHGRHGLTTTTSASTISSAVVFARSDIDRVPPGRRVLPIGSPRRRPLRRRERRIGEEIGEDHRRRHRRGTSERNIREERSRRPGRGGLWLTGSRACGPGESRSGSPAADARMCAGGDRRHAAGELSASATRGEREERGQSVTGWSAGREVGGPRSEGRRVATASIEGTRPSQRDRARSRQRIASLAT